jgi:hypothetical protein
MNLCRDIEKLKNRCLYLLIFCRKKFEIATDEVGNFIKQDEKKGVLREVSVRRNLFCCVLLFQSQMHLMFHRSIITVQEGRYLLQLRMSPGKKEHVSLFLFPYFGWFGLIIYFLCSGRGRTLLLFTPMRRDAEVTMIPSMCAKSVQESSKRA